MELSIARSPEVGSVWPEAGGVRTMSRDIARCLRCGHGRPVDEWIEDNDFPPCAYHPSKVGNWQVKSKSDTSFAAPEFVRVYPCCYAISSRRRIDGSIARCYPRGCVAHSYHFPERAYRVLEAKVRDALAAFGFPPPILRAIAEYVLVGSVVCRPAVLNNTDLTIG